MKNHLSLILLLAMFVSACVKNELEDKQLQLVSGRVFTASFESDNARAYIEDGNLLRWNAGDQIALFDSNTLNRQYQFDGETGDNAGTFSIVNAPFGTGNDLDCHYALYPYASDVKISDSGVITATLLPVQSYAENSFGQGANTMVAVTKDVKDTFLKFKNIGGYLKLQLYGENLTIKSITLTGNNNEKLAGKATITPAYGQNPTVAMKDDATTSITLDCGEGVKIGSTEETATAFWIVVPPTTFEEGLTTTVTEIDGESFTKSTSNAVVVERNIIKPMAAFEVEIEIEKIPNNQIWYTSGEPVTPKETGENCYGANIVSNEWDSKTGKGIITFDEDITKIGDHAFSAYDVAPYNGRDKITSISLPNSVCSIGASAFANCKGLVSINIPEKVTSIGEQAFSGCMNLTNIVIPNSVTEINWNAFGNCSSLKTIIIPKSITKIENAVFSSCSSLTSVTIPDSVTQIGDNVFDGCNNLSSITIPESVTYIGSNVFGYCSNLSAFYGKFASSDHRCLIVDNAIRAFATYGLDEYSIPYGITSIDDWAFHSCSLINITIPDSITYIGSSAFLQAWRLTSVVIPNSVTTIGIQAFSGCSNLTNINIPEGVTMIGDCTFQGCKKLTSIIIPEGVTSIGELVFWGCKNLKKVYCKPTTPPTIGTDAFSDIVSGSNSPIGCIIYVPRESVDAYKSADGWKDYADYIMPYDFWKEDGEIQPKSEIWYTATDKVTPNRLDRFGVNIVSNEWNAETKKGVIKCSGDITSIGNNAFENCSNLTSIAIPDGVTFIGEYAFGYCSNMTTISIPDSVNEISSYAFEKCSSLVDVNIPKGISVIKGATFRACTSLTALVIPGNVTTIEDEAFIVCTSLKNLILEKGVTSIGIQAFAACSKLENVYIPDSVIRIKDGAFYGCEKLANITIPNSVTYIGGSAFQYCKSLTSVTIPDSVLELGEAAFAGCNKMEAFNGKYASEDNRYLLVDGVLNSFAQAGLTEYTIPESVTKIGSSAFEDCSDLTSVTLHNKITSIGEDSFRGCRGFRSITIPESVTSIERQAFEGCVNLKMVYCKPIAPPTVYNAEYSYIFSIYNQEQYEHSYLDCEIYVPSYSVGAYKAHEEFCHYKIVPYEFEDDNSGGNGDHNKIYYTSTAKLELANSNAFGVAILSHEWDYGTGIGVIKCSGDVKAIGDKAFYNCSSLKDIDIPDSVTEIGQYAFCNCSNLANITIPNGVTTIRDYTFGSCSKLANITIPDSVTFIGTSAFHGCGLTSVTIPSSVTKIGGFAFHFCWNLSDMTIINSATEIDSTAITNCEKLRAFHGALASADNRCLVINGILKAFAPANLTEYTIPNNVTTIGDYVFVYCSNLKSVTIPNSTSTIGNYAFLYCSGLTNVTISDGVTTIGSSAFSGCNSLASVTIPESITQMGYGVFSGCNNMTAFYGKFASADNRTLVIDGAICEFASKGITEYTIPSDIRAIGYYAFSGCDNLTSVTIPDSVTQINGAAFYDCANLRDVTIGSNVTSIDWYAFYYCPNLKDVYCKSATPPTAVSDQNIWSAFDYNASGRKIYVPRESLDMYKSANYWSNYASSIEGYDF